MLCFWPFPFPSIALCEELGGFLWWAVTAGPGVPQQPPCSFPGPPSMCSFLHCSRAPMSFGDQDKGDHLQHVAGTPVYPHANLMAPSFITRPRNSPLSTPCRQRTRQTNGIHMTNLWCVTSWCLHFFLIEKAQEPHYSIDLQPDTSSYFCLNPYGASLLLVF